MLKFEDQFEEYVCVGDYITVEKDGIEYHAVIEFDEDYHIDDDDVHNTDQSVTGCSDEQFRKLLAARKAWRNDEWFYCGIVVTASKRNIELCSASLWGIEANYPESDNEYLTEVANELLEEVEEQAPKALKELIQKLEA